MPDDIRQRRYVEPFGGAGTIILNKPRSAQEVYNDVNGYLVNLFRWVQKNPEALLERVKYILNSRAEFDAAHLRLYENKYGDDSLQAAADFYQCHVQSYAGKGDHFGANFRSIRAGFPIIELAFQRLQRVVVEQWDFEKLLRVYSCPNGFYYMDPPYFYTEDAYPGGHFGPETHVRLRDVAMELPGLWMISYNLTEEVLKLYEQPGIYIEHLTRLNNMAQRFAAGAIYDEVLITNFDTSKVNYTPSGQLLLPDYSITQRRNYIWPKQ